MKLRTLVIATASLLSCSVLQAQQARYDYVDLNMRTVSPDQAAFRRSAVLKEDGFFHVIIKFLDGQTRMTGRYEDEALRVENGWFEFFFFGGQRESEGEFQGGQKVGIWKRWNWNGEALPDRHYAFPEEMELNRAASFPGGHAELQAYIAQNLEYPEAAHQNRIEGLVEVAFSIDETGRIHNIEVITPAHPLLDDATFRLVAAMPAWEPAVKRGEGILSHFILPITFALDP